MICNKFHNKKNFEKIKIGLFALKKLLKRRFFAPIFCSSVAHLLYCSQLVIN